MELKSLIFLLALAAGSARALVLPRDPQPSSSQQSYPNSTDISVFNGQCKSHVERKKIHSTCALVSDVGLLL